MTQDYYDNGYRDARGFERSHCDDDPQNESDRMSYQRGYEYGLYRVRIAEELDRERYGDYGYNE